MEWDGVTLGFGEDEVEVKDRLVKLRKAIFSFPKESSPGPSGLRPDHVKAMLLGLPEGEGLELVRELDIFVRRALRGELPRSVGPILCSARLTPLRKTTKQTEHTDAWGQKLVSPE